MAKGESTKSANADAGIDRLVQIMRKLRDPECGCPWDIEQDFDTIAPYTIEEAYEVADAIRKRDWNELKGELGDLLLQAVYHSQIAYEKNLFDFDEVAHASADKMVSRHPHVFEAESQEKTAEEQILDWERSKARERKDTEDSALSGIAVALPALTRALKLQKRAALVGFDWNSSVDVLEKVVEEAKELEAIDSAVEKARAEEEFGDLLFSLVNLARHLSLDAESALRRANEKFQRRFSRMEQRIKETGRDIRRMEIDELDEAWNAVKLGESKEA
ncbi:MAG: nucleoside triphosphate pyrophosphohydrolase [Albidovulum sp.]|nr:nucleoside triphosphate pyrophosphohydrolase [Albidovulum sp.]MDE0308175.1 nucleoside triphosphate pyrophosphohydrolase [Albidovulum sp.]